MKSMTNLKIDSKWRVIRYLWINPLLHGASFLYPLKTSENRSHELMRLHNTTEHNSLHESSNQNHQFFQQYRLYRMHISKPYVSIDNSNLVNLGSIISLPREITEDVVGLPSKEKKSAKRIIRKRIITNEITCNNNNTSGFLQKLYVVKAKKKQQL